MQSNDRATQGWRIFGGFEFREVGRMRFEFRSRSSPNTVYTTDVEERTCSCWPHTRGSSPTGVCPHFRLLSVYFQRLAKAMSEASPETLNQQTK